ncbi:MAG: 2-C-methyl-D-erythritol 4-phosphate cytidylyltransferase, partial [Pseudomonadota bacterium]
MTGCVAIVVASGRGQRFGHELPKQYAPLFGVPLLKHTLMRFSRHPDITGVRTVIHPDDRSHYDQAVAGLDLLAPVFGGETRQDSGRLGLESLTENPPEKVLIHDAARPLVSAEVIARVVAALDRHDGVLPV